MTGGVKARFKLDYTGFSLDVDLVLPGTGVTALFGHSGSGKTTVLRLIAGLEKSAHGHLEVNGEVWQDGKRLFLPTHQRNLGYVFQEASLFAHLNVQRNLAYGMNRVPPAQRQVSLDQAVELLGIGHLLQRLPETLSGGERQRVAIARALATSPQILLMDEPLAALDLKRKEEILPYLQRLHDELKIPIVYVTHSPDEVARLADHLVLLDAGRVVAQGRTGDLLTRLDLPMAHGDAASALVTARISGHDAAYHLAHAEFAGGHISLTQGVGTALPLGSTVRLRVQARDVSLTLDHHRATSILNVLPVTVTDLSPDSPGQVMVGLDAGGTRLLARITTKSADALALAPGKAAFAQVKGVAVVG
ncbi:MAG: molybdenum ABC transporter ATP-binding protein [Pseudomonadota bacterium]